MFSSSPPPDPSSFLNLPNHHPNNIPTNNIIINSHNLSNYNNWNWFLQFLITLLFLGLGFLYLLRSTASKFFATDNSAVFDSPSPSDSSLSAMTAATSTVEGGCAVCGKVSKRRCSGCKSVFYCSVTCQREHWKSEHKTKCKELGSFVTENATQHSGVKRNRSIALVPSGGADNIHKIVNKVLFPYDEFVKLFNWDNSIFPPCGLLNCGNSCFANVVLQCLAHTRPLVAYLLQKGHRRDCRRDEWCFLCELELYMDRASRNQQPFSPINILSRLPSIGGSFGNGRQEDAHEFMRFAIDMMQSVCLDEHGGERVIDPKSQETTLIQHIFGGQLRSQVLCTRCDQVSNQYENMMDLTVEIQGDVTSLEECLDQFTAKEWLHGENLYKCDRCNGYVRASKRLTIHHAPNILTIALKRFQSGRFGKINKKISFPECLNLSPFMNEERDGTDKYKLYAVVVHVDMLNASFFGHYICYTKGFEGEWYRIDDCKVARVDLDEVLSQGSYMLLYRRISARPKCLKTFEPAMHQQQHEDIKEEHNPIRFSNSVNCLESSSCNGSLVDIAANKNQEDNDVTESRVKHDPVGSAVPDPPLSLKVMSGDDAPVSLTAADAHKVFTSPIYTPAESSDVADVHGSSVVNASGDTACEESATVPLCDEETNGELEEHRSDKETTQNAGATLLDQVPLCEMNYIGNSSDADSSHHINGDKNVAETSSFSLGKLGSETSLEDMEVASVELKESNNSSGGAGDDMIICEDPVNTSLDMRLEKPYVHDHDPCISNGHVEISGIS